ncbi:hypothetical protein [Ottowia thiooxydans]|uniref:Uncharacterized protein n=1 Tax=Ottowia thiooxydans TaxID=219182 RepID=A0ABV2Q9N4_9BURK
MSFSAQMVAGVFCGMAVLQATVGSARTDGLDQTQVPCADSSALDYESEVIVQRGMAQICKGRAVAVGPFARADLQVQGELSSQGPKLAIGVPNPKA